MEDNIAKIAKLARFLSIIICLMTFIGVLSINFGWENFSINCFLAALTCMIFEMVLFSYILIKIFWREKE